MASREPFLITRTWPVWRQTKSRPSGANSIAVGEPERGLPNGVSVNPAGKFAAIADRDTWASRAVIAKIDIEREPVIEKKCRGFIDYY